MPEPLPPSIDEILRRLDRLAHDPKQPTAIRLRLIEILFEHGDPNKCLDLAIELASTQGTRLKRAETFRLCTPCRGSRKLSNENREKYLNHAYRLLEDVDDGHSGQGYFLALHIGQFVGLPPVRRGVQQAFEPDRRLNHYEGPDGFKRESFFQDTVKNARKWWNDHKDQY